MTMPKTPKMTPLDKILQGNRYTRDEAAEVKADFETWAGHADTRRDQVSSLTESELGTILEHVEGLAELGGIFPQIAEHLNALSNLTADLGDIEQKLGEFTEAWESFAEYATTYIDKEGDRDEIAEARDEMEGLADTLNSIKAELLQLGLDLEIEA